MSKASTNNMYSNVTTKTAGGKTGNKRGPKRESQDNMQETLQADETVILNNTMEDSAQQATPCFQAADEVVVPNQEAVQENIVEAQTVSPVMSTKKRKWAEISMEEDVVDAPIKSVR